MFLEVLARFALYKFTCYLPNLGGQLMKHWYSLLTHKSWNLWNLVGRCSEYLL